MDPQGLILIVMLLGLVALAAREAAGAGGSAEPAAVDVSALFAGVPLYDPYDPAAFYFPIEPTPAAEVLREPYYYLPESGGPMTTSATGVQLIKRFEGGPALTAYRDPGGVLTIGYGHTGPDVYTGMSITAARAEQLLRADLAGAEAAVTNAVQVPVTQGQFDALVSLVFNIGAGAFAASTLLRKLNAGDYAGAAQEFDRWVYDKQASPDPLLGLVRRRNAEQQLFLAG